MYPCEFCRKKARIVRNLKSDGFSERRLRACLRFKRQAQTVEISEAAFQAHVRKRMTVRSRASCFGRSRRRCCRFSGNLWPGRSRILWATALAAGTTRRIVALALVLATAQASAGLFTSNFNTDYCLFW